MFLVSGPELVIAACKAGIVGAFPTPNARPIATLEAWMERIASELCGATNAGPWAANLVTHSSNTRLPEDLRLVAKYRPPIVITALGSPKPALDIVHDYGGLVFGDVVNLKLARKAVEAGVDGLACIAAGAGGHTGSISPFAFISAVREFFEGTIVVGGAIADGAGIAGVIAAGADLVYMGTRFIATDESLAAPGFKAMLPAATLDDLVVSAGITGTPASWLKPSLRENGIDPDRMPDAPGRHYDTSGQSLEGKSWMNLWSAGQGVGAVRRIEPVAAVVDTLEREYRAARSRFASFP